MDRIRRLNPHDYCTDPDQFGRSDRASFHVPDGGNQQEMRIAQRQHMLVVCWRDRSQDHPAKRLTGLFGFSAQIWSKVTLGQRWMCAATAAALYEGSDLDPGAFPV